MNCRETEQAGDLGMTERVYKVRIPFFPTYSDGYSGYFFGENWANDLISNNNVCGYRDFATADSRAEDLLEGGRISRSAQTAIWRSSRRGRRRNSMCFIW